MHIFRIASLSYKMLFSPCLCAYVGLVISTFMIHIGFVPSMPRSTCIFQNHYPLALRWHFCRWHTGLTCSAFGTASDETLTFQTQSLFPKATCILSYWQKPTNSLCWSFHLPTTTASSVRQNLRNKFTHKIYLARNSKKLPKKEGAAVLARRASSIFHLYIIRKLLYKKLIYSMI